MGYAKGQSGNPGGRPRLPEKLQARMALAMQKAQDVTPEAIERLIAIMRGADDKLALRAAEILLLRAMGAPVVVVEQKKDEPVQMVQLADGVFEAK